MDGEDAESGAAKRRDSVPATASADVDEALVTKEETRRRYSHPAAIVLYMLIVAGILAAVAAYYKTPMPHRGR